MDYKKAWTVYKRLNRVHIALCFSAPLWYVVCFPFALLVVNHFDLPADDSHPALLFLSIGPWLITFLVFHIWFSFWPCPRCGKPFFFKWFLRTMFRRHCVHCGLRP